MPMVLLSPLSKQQILSTIRTTSTKFGQNQRQKYKSLIDAAVEDL